MPLVDVMNSLETKSKRAKSENPKKYVQFTGDEWKELEAGNGSSLEPAHVKALLQGIFSGRVNVSQKKG